jgi:hypothetical protein
LAGLYPGWLDTGCDGAFSGLFQNNTYAFLFLIRVFLKRSMATGEWEKKKKKKKTLE